MAIKHPHFERYTDDSFYERMWKTLGLEGNEMESMNTQKLKQLVLKKRKELRESGIIIAEADIDFVLHRINKRAQSEGGMRGYIARTIREQIGEANSNFDKETGQYTISIVQLAQVEIMSTKIVETYDDGQLKCILRPKLFRLLLESNGKYQLEDKNYYLSLMNKLKANTEPFETFRKTVKGKKIKEPKALKEIADETPYAYLQNALGIVEKLELETIPSSDKKDTHTTNIGLTLNAIAELRSLPKKKKKERKNVLSTMRIHFSLDKNANEEEILTVCSEKILNILFKDQFTALQKNIDSIINNVSKVKSIDSTHQIMNLTHAKNSHYFAPLVTVVKGFLQEFIQEEYKQNSLKYVLPSEVNLESAQKLIGLVNETLSAKVIAELDTLKDTFRDNINQLLNEHPEFESHHHQVQSMLKEEDNPKNTAGKIIKMPTPLGVKPAKMAA